MKDFTFKTYIQILKTFKAHGYQFYTLEQYINEFKNGRLQPRFVILRHDVDRKPNNSLTAAKIEKGLAIKASYYFRIGKESNQPLIIKQIASMGHEIGYHYEDLAIAHGDYEKALKTFEQNLKYFRQYYPVKTMCMHGSPLSKWDNKLLWKKYDYKMYNIIAEPYFDLNFDEIFYLTDASRAWNDERVTFRDKVKTKFNLNIKSTVDIYELLNSNKLPSKLMLNTHPHNWSNNNLEWLYVLAYQSFKNEIKKLINLAVRNYNIFN